MRLPPSFIERAQKLFPSDAFPLEGFWHDSFGARTALDRGDLPAFIKCLQKELDSEATALVLLNKEPDRQSRMAQRYSDIRALLNRAEILMSRAKGKDSQDHSP